MIEYLEKPTIDRLSVFCFNYPYSDWLDDTVVNELMDVLTPAERRYIVNLPVNCRIRRLSSRATIRLVLADMLGCDPVQVALAISRYGKIYLTGSPCFVSVTHSHTMGVLVISPCNLGVDLEWLNRRPIKLRQKLLTRMDPVAFESMQLGGVEHRIDLDMQFTAWWTMQESVVKYYASTIWNRQWSGEYCASFWRSLFEVKWLSALLVRDVSNELRIKTVAKVPVSPDHFASVWQFGLSGAYLGCLTTQRSIDDWRAYNLRWQPANGQCRRRLLAVPLKINWVSV